MAIAKSKAKSLPEKKAENTGLSRPWKSQAANLSGLRPGVWLQCILGRTKGSEQMARLFRFGLKIEAVVRIVGERVRHALDHGNALGVERFHFFGIVCQ